MITITDIFAGAGGSTSGAVSIPGVEVRVAANHWQMAVDVHQINHPGTDHACVDLHLEDPRNFPRTDILWASPECTKWSQARGKSAALSAELGGDATLFDDVPDELISTEDDEITRHFSSPVAEYLRTLTAAAQQSVVTPGDVEAARAQVDDCLFRMLEPHEVAAGMAFPLDYQWLGTRRDRVKLAGNAVCPPAARDLIGAVVAALGDAA